MMERVVVAMRSGAVVMANEKDDGANTVEARGSAREQDEELARRVRELERENRRLRERCEEAELESAELEKSLKNSENTLSFRLGHALIQATKSVDGVRALPALLAELRRDSRRRKKRADRSLIEAAARTSVARIGKLLKR